MQTVCGSLQTRDTDLPGLLCGISGNADGSYKYAMGEKDGDLRQFTKEMNAKLNGRGGGKPFFVQGSVQASEKEIRNFF